MHTWLCKQKSTSALYTYMYHYLYRKQLLSSLQSQLGTVRPLQIIPKVMQLHHIVYTGILHVYIPIGSLIRLSWGRPTSVVITWSHKRPLHSGRYTCTSAPHTKSSPQYTCTLFQTALFSGQKLYPKTYFCFHTHTHTAQYVVLCQINYFCLLQDQVRDGTDMSS